MLLIQGDSANLFWLIQRLLMGSDLHVSDTFLTDLLCFFLFYFTVSLQCAHLGFFSFFPGLDD